MKYISLTLMLLVLFSFKSQSQNAVGTWKISIDDTEQYIPVQYKAEFQKTKTLKKLFLDSMRFICSQNSIFTIVTYSWGLKEEKKGHWHLSPDKKKMTIKVEDMTKILEVLELSSQKMVLKDKTQEEKINILVLIPAK